MTIPDNAEPAGGDPPCWAHVFDDGVCQGEDRESDGQTPMVMAAPGTNPVQAVDLPRLVRAATTGETPWIHQSEDLNVNLLVFARDEGVDEHVNGEVDVLLVGIAGEGIVNVDGMRRVLRAGYALLIPKGARRGMRGLSEPFAYLSCHRRRGGLWPST